jgi:hypothetical protein
MATPEQWPKIKEIVGAALEREPKERGTFLDQAVRKAGSCERKSNPCSLLMLTPLDCPRILGRRPQLLSLSGLTLRYRTCVLV